MVKTTVNIDGMMCGMCETHVNDVIRKNFAVKKVSSSHKKACSEIISEQAIDEDKLKAAIADIGYTVQSVQSEPYEKPKFSLFGRK